MILASLIQPILEKVDLGWVLGGPFFFDGNLSDNRTWTIFFSHCSVNMDVGATSLAPSSGEVLSVIVEITALLWGLHP